MAGEVACELRCSRIPICYLKEIGEEKASEDATAVN